MKKQIMTIVFGAVFALGTTAAFAQSNGTAYAGGAAGGPNGIYQIPQRVRRPTSLRRRTRV